MYHFMGHRPMRRAVRGVGDDFDLSAVVSQGVQEVQGAASSLVQSLPPEAQQAAAAALSQGIKAAAQQGGAVVQNAFSPSSGTSAATGHGLLENLPKFAQDVKFISARPELKASAWFVAWTKAAQKPDPLDTLSSIADPTARENQRLAIYRTYGYPLGPTYTTQSLAANAARQAAVAQNFRNTLQKAQKLQNTGTTSPSATSIPWGLVAAGGAGILLLGGGFLLLRH